LNLHDLPRTDMYPWLRICLLLSLTLGLPATTLLAAENETKRTNVLFIAIDDLNHWMGHLKRNPQTITPNLDRLADRGVSFAHAYCAAPACNPSRAALMSGMRPFTTGVYHNSDDYKPHIQPEQTLNSHFRANGYLTVGAGKIYHGGGGRRSEWDDYGARKPTKDLGAFSSHNANGVRWSQLKGGDDVLNDYHTVQHDRGPVGRPRLASWRETALAKIRIVGGGDPSAADVGCSRSHPGRCDLRANRRFHEHLSDALRVDRLGNARSLRRGEHRIAVA
jgi:hypothetical protein